MTLGATEGSALPGRVLWDMVPGSAHFVGLHGVNTGANLAREQATGMPRIGVQSRLRSGYGMFFQAVVPDKADEYTIAWWGAGAAYILAFEYFNSYSSRTDPYAYEKQSNALLWYMGAVAITSLDANYCRLVGEVTPVVGGVICEYSDAVVTFDSQEYPGGINLPIVGPPHTRETVSPLVYERLQFALENAFGIGRRPFSVRISPSPSQLYVSQSAQLTVSGIDYENNPTPVSGGTWSSSNPGIASVNASTGVVTGVASGNATITVTAEGLSADMVISVLAAPPITAVSILGPSDVQSGTSRTWTASVTGGVAPLKYQWSVNGTSYPSFTGSSFAYTNTGSSFTVYVTVTSAVGGSSKMASKHVGVAGSCTGFSC